MVQLPKFMTIYAYYFLTWVCLNAGNAEILLKKQSAQQIVDIVSRLKKHTKLEIFSPVVRGKKGEHKGSI